MQDILIASIKQMRKQRARRIRAVAVLLILSLLVSMDVFWVLRQPGLTLAGNADCNIIEHTHDEQCQTPCDIEEHVHSIECYCDPTAGVETQLDWQKMFASYPYTENLRENLVGIAKMQVGYAENQLNFQVDGYGIRRGYTRYGAWYGAPYNDWTAMFVSFCLHYAGADPEEFPANTGANSMAELWKVLERYADVGTYDPIPGDLVFFTDNTVGIITEVYTGTLNVIKGDVEDAVRSSMLVLTDETIAGWGITEATAFDVPETTPTEETIPEESTTGETISEETVPEETTLDEDLVEKLLDISNGPVFIITEGDDAIPIMRYTLRNTPREIIDLLPYLEKNGGSYFFTLLDYDNKELPKDDDGNYIAIANQGYKITVTFNAPYGFAPGTYQYQVPNGLMVDGGSGTFILKDNTNVGAWEVTDTGLITLVFNENMNSRTNITISSTMGIHFPEQQDPIDFDGMITVKVEPPAQQKFPTTLLKWNENEVEGKTDNGKLNWAVLITGHADSQIPGNIITDKVLVPDWGKPHSYTQSDMDAGITISATSPDGQWHIWTVTTDDPHLVWTESEWSYKFPQTVHCNICGELELGSDGWEYKVQYTSTPTDLNIPGTFQYSNEVTIDGQTQWGWAEFTHGQVDATINKDGTFVSDAAGGGFLWEFQVTIPGRPEGQRAEYAWFVMDEMKMVNGAGITLRKVHNDVNLATVTAMYNGTLIEIPRVQEATDQDMFAWDAAWASDGIAATRTINLLCRCQCTPDTCHWGGCEQYWVKYEDGSSKQNGFCQCWTENQNMTFNFVYRTQDTSLVEAYGTLGYQLNNMVQLYYMTDGSTSIRVDNDDATVPIPNLFEKQLTHDFDGYTANYKITVNEAKLVLTDGSPLTIHDMMSTTLAYISGSLVITAEDADGNITTLQQGADFTVAYDGTGKQFDGKGNPVHTLDIIIKHPQPVKYLLDYDATLIMPEHITGGIKYTNSASITLWGSKITDNSVEKVYADINIASTNYRIELVKTCAETGAFLEGATFGLFNEQGGRITTAVTNTNGLLVFQSNIVQGIILREHTLYYVQELTPPPGYQLDATKHWLFFCDAEGEDCETCDQLLAATSAERIRNQHGNIQVVNHIALYELPQTGGPGIYPLLLVSVIFIITPLVYEFIRWRKRERRGVG